MRYGPCATGPNAGKSERTLDAPGSVSVRARVAAYLDPEPSVLSRAIKSRPLSDKPYWDIERARIEGTRTVPLEGNLCVCERSGKRDVRLAYCNPNALDEWQLERPLGDSFPDFLEKIGVAPRDDVGDEVVDAAIVDDVLRRRTLSGSPDPQRSIDLDRLRDLRLMRQNANARMKAHRFERDYIAIGRGAAIHREPLADYE